MGRTGAPRAVPVVLTPAAPPSHLGSGPTSSPLGLAVLTAISKVSDHFRASR